MRTAANGALDLRVGSNVAPELLEQAVAAARSLTMVHATSRAIQNTVVPIMAIAAFALVALRSRP